MKKNSHTNPAWYVVYTYPKSEKQVSNKIKELGYETFLPTQHIVRQWSDRKKKLEEPLFPNYVFVKTSLQERFNILKVRGLVRFIAFDGKPVSIPEEEIQSIRKVLNGNVSVSSSNANYTIGDKVKITHGQFAGTEGVLIRENGKDRFAVQLQALKQSVIVDISKEYIANCDFS
ncbi:MAG: UpxY family transcription antiterminator [Bacteroidota bacterium]